MVLQSFVYGGERFEYEICFSPNRTRKIAIHVHPNASIQVDAPEDEEDTNIHQAVLKRARWIKTHVAEARRHNEHVLPRQYVSGESYFYLGRRYQLKVRLDPQAKPSVKLLRGHLNVECPSSDSTVIKKHLWAWYRDRAKEVFQRRLIQISEEAMWIDQIPEWRLLSMKKQWGSCSPKGVLLLNPHLVKAPRECVDYVIRHEICHLKHHNHSQKFYRQMVQLMPHWKSVKIRLDGMAELLLNE